MSETETRPPEVERRDGDDLLGALDLLVEFCRDNEPVLPQFEAVGAFFRAGGKPAVPKCMAGWPELIGRAGALAWLSAAPGTAPEVRGELLRFLAAWGESPFVEDVGRFRWLVGDLAREDVPFPLERKTKWEQDAWGAGEDGGNRWFVNGFVQGEAMGKRIRVLECATSGAFRDLPWARLEREVRFPDGGWATGRKIQRFVKVVGAQGPFPVERAHAEDLAARTGMTYAEAVLILLGFPRLREESRDFLPPEVRERFGLEPADAAVARDAWLARGERERRDVLDGAMPEDAEFLHDAAALVSRLAASATRVLGARLTLPPDLFARLEEDVGFVDPPNSMVGILAEPDKAPRLNADGNWVLLEKGAVARAIGDPGDEVFDGNLLASIAVYLAYAYAEFPAGHPLRRRFADIHSRVRRRLAHPGFLLGGLAFDGGPKNAAVGELLSGANYRIPEGVKGRKVIGRDTGDLVALLDLAGGQISVGWRPGRVDDWSRIERMEVGAPYHGLPGSTIARFLVSEGLARIVDRVERGGLPEGAWEVNPLQSIPDLVREAQTALEASEDAAVLYLQILTLPEPSWKSVRTWNDWKKGRLDAACEELQKRDLVVEAKRTRAGRDLFLPGAWEPLGKPNAPMETWKLPLYGATRDAKGRPVLPLRRVLPLSPLPELFVEAWRRSREEGLS